MTYTEGTAEAHPAAAPQATARRPAAKMAALLTAAALSALACVGYFSPATIAAGQKQSGGVSFVHAPFNDLRKYWADPSKPSVIKGEWHTDAKEGENYDSPILKGLSQQGFYVPTVDGKPKPFTLYKAREARECLAHKQVYFGGDSYMEQFYIGLVDVLLDVGSENRNFGGAGTSFDRRIIGESKNRTLHQQYPELAGIRLECVNKPECYGTSFVHEDGSACAAGKSQEHWDGEVPWDAEAWARNGGKGSGGGLPGCTEKPNPDENSLKVCNQCLQNLPEADALVIGSAPHLLMSRGSDEGAGQKVEEDIQWLRAKHQNMIWVSAPKINPAKVTKAQMKYFTPTNQESLNRIGTLDVCKKHGVCLDMYHLTSRCAWDNCTTDGGHRARYVNRMKAQMLLNTLCTKSESVLDQSILAHIQDVPVKMWDDDNDGTLLQAASKELVPESAGEHSSENYLNQD